MTANEVSKKAEKGLLQLVVDQNARHRDYAGTASEAFNTTTLNQALNAVYFGTSPTAENVQMLQGSAAGALYDIAPTDAVEGMMAAQMVATHNATMECYRRAMVPGQSHLVRESNLMHANRLTRSYATLVHALDKHRGKGQQTVRVEHVHVHEGGQAIVGNVTHEARRRDEEAAGEAVAARGRSKHDD